MQNNQGYIVNFSQGDFINYLKSNDKDLDPYKRAEALALLEKYNGLCDIICNHITQENLLSDQSKLEEYLQRSNISNSVKDLIEYSSTHVWNINSITRFFELIICLVLGHYPESPLSWSDQKQLNNPKTETYAINKCLSNMREGDYYKLCTIEKENGVIAGGHSMLIYKSSNDKFTFFDPSKGATINLDLATITDKIKTEEGEIAIMDNKKFLSKHHRKTIDKFKQFMLKKGLQPQEFTKRERAYFNH